MLKATNLSHKFEYPLFNNISFSLEAQESMAIIGVSGSGKSTLMHILATLLEPIEGEVELFGESIYKLSQKELLKLRRNDIGIIFQQHYLFKGFLAKENLEVAALLAGTTIDTELLKRLGIDKLMHQKITELSGGQQQRVSIARVLTKKPKIIFADEPTGNLDEETAFEVMDILSEYIKNENAILVMVTHDQRLARRCEKTYSLQEQQLVLI
ncbi:MAG: ABC transporter ATP-binding protein [Thiovulaceae bacterium]|nr:ABC transporter ATP-binding protein [Sulfurimonadaceae bacterium]